MSFSLVDVLSATARSSIWQRVYTIIFHRLVRRFEHEGSTLPVGRTPVNEQFSGRLVGETSNLLQVDLYRQQETRLFTSCQEWRPSTRTLFPPYVEGIPSLEYYQLTWMIPCHIDVRNDVKEISWLFCHVSVFKSFELYYIFI